MNFKNKLKSFKWRALFFFLIIIGMGSSNELYAQISVTGRVTDSQNQALPGVSIKLKGANNYALTNDDGNYTIKVPDGNAILVFSYVSFLTEEKTVGTNKVINVTLVDSANDLDEVVVVGYGTEKRSDLTGSVSTLKLEELNLTKSVSFIEAMQGRLAGVQVTSSSGEPGAAVTINIRGANSINAGNTPLYVIDGVQIDANNGESASFSSLTNPLSSINPADIESMEILKDASATAIFGSRGANGVIIITTKTGKGKGSLEFQNYTGVSYANNRLNVANGQQYANYRYELNPNDAAYNMDTNGDNIPDAPKDFSNEPQFDW
jgi:TonB-dependent SusC/RagA subfamily outer membrane receptor